MKGDFEWQVADEMAPAPPYFDEEPEGALGRPGRGRWLVLLAAVVVLGAAVGWLYREARERTAAAREATVAEVLASHRLLLQATDARDRELATNLLSGRDRAWAAQQRARVEGGTLLAEPGLGLIAAGEAAVVETLSPALDEAAVVMTQTVRLGDEAESGHLVRTWLYRRGEGGWLYAPPREPADYWGRQEQLELVHLAVQYPARDEALAARLSQAMDEALLRACATVTCREDFEMVVVLATQPTSLEMPSLERLVYEEGPLTLPAPSWIGVPVDEAGFELLARAYTRPVLLAALGRELWGWQCCDHAPLFQALLDAQLAQWGMQPWPLTRADYEFLLARDFRLFEDTMASWYGQAFSRQRDAAWLQAHAVVAFLLAQKPDADLGELAARLNEAPNYWFWALDFLDERVGDAELEARWEMFAQQAR
ncbi:MAG: hypothetical protein RRC07_15935 [Anaerolineae bacterium]|nr:hypothetical protein [Anaerolineae bacterium]